MNRDIKEFQKRFERWKAGENYWKDIRGIDLFAGGTDDNWTKYGYEYIGDNDSGEPMYRRDEGITNIIEREHPDGSLTYHYKMSNGEVPLTKIDEGRYSYENTDGSTSYFDINKARAYRQWQKEGGAAKDIDKVALGIMALPLAGGLAAEAVAAAPALVPGGAFWTNPLTQGIFAGELGARGWDLANIGLTGNTWAQNLSKDIHKYTGWNPQESIGGQFLTEASNPFYYTPYNIVAKVIDAGVNAATNAGRATANAGIAAAKTLDYLPRKISPAYDLYRTIGETTPRTTPTLHNFHTRTRLGDVEIDDPNLLYHLDNGDGLGWIDRDGAYVKDGLLYPGKTIAPNQQDYTWWNRGKPFINTRTKRLMTASPDNPSVMRVRDQDFPIGQWNGKSGFVLNSEYVSAEPVDVSRSTYIFDPNYGYRRVLAEDIPTITF